MISLILKIIFLPFTLIYYLITAFTGSPKDNEFEKESNLWGLSKEDKRIAKQERMSPADFVEAEERDDDELFTDEWE